MQKIYIRRGLIIRKLTILFLFVCLVISFFNFSVFALTPAPQRPYEILLDDGNRIFIMTPQWLTPGQEESDERMQIRSGLYYNTSPLVNIYYVDEYFHYGTIFFSRDGMNFAVVRSMVTSDPTAVAFYENGSLHKSYTAQELLRDWSRAFIVAGGAGWERRQGREFDEQQGILTVVANDGRVIAFDIITGNIVSETAGTPVAVIIVSIVLLVILGAVVFVLCRRVLLRKRS